MERAAERHSPAPRLSLLGRGREGEWNVIYRTKVGAPSAERGQPQEATRHDRKTSAARPGGHEAARGLQAAQREPAALGQGATRNTLRAGYGSARATCRGSGRYISVLVSAVQCCNDYYLSHSLVICDNLTNCIF